MTKYRATIHVSGITSETPTAARAELEALLRQCGIENCRVISVDPEGLAARPAQRHPVAAAPDAAWRRQSNAGGLLLVAAAAWAIWFFWWMLSHGHE